MKYRELHKKLRAIGCYPIGHKQISGHPAWFSPITGKFFPTSHHETADVKPGTLKNILKDSGLTL
jgi:predicted RNA binding protein YcfA (HicA-like mRNA interferase family)